MVIKVFITSVSANSVLKKNQQTIIDTLSAKNIPFETIDISSPENEEQKLYMREKAKPKDGQANAMPPQLFSDDDYLGDYDAFYEANEDNELDVFFKLATATKKSEATLTVTPEDQEADSKEVVETSAEEGVTNPTEDCGERAGNSEPTSDTAEESADNSAEQEDTPGEKEVEGDNSEAIEDNSGEKVEHSED